MKQIRVGIIRCDGHALYFGAQMARHDPRRLREPRHHSGAGHHWSKTGAGVFLYFYLDYTQPMRMTAPFVPGFKLVKVWDADRENAEILSEIFIDPPKVCDTLDEVSDDVDLVFMADCNGDGADKLKLAAPSIEKRVPTFIDKPLSYDIGGARRIVDLARKKRTPILSLSIMRCVPDAARFSMRLPEVGTLGMGNIIGGGAHMAGHIHAISLAQHVFGTGVQSVSCMGELDLAVIRLKYGDRKDRPKAGVTINCDCGPGWHGAFHVDAYGNLGAIHSGPIGDFAYPHGSAEILRRIKEMVRTGKSHVPYGDMIENIAVATAARKAQKTGRTVQLEGL